MTTYALKRLSALGTVMVPVLAATVVAASPAGAGTGSATIEFGAAEGLAQAANGDTVELTGEGSVTLQPKSASDDAPDIAAAFGVFPREFTHRNAGGAVLAQGTWEPTAVLSYLSYGAATAEQSAEFGGLPPGTEGGKLRVKVALSVGGVQVGDGIVTIVCLLGEPPTNAEEANLLLIQGTDYNFNKPVHGDNVFIRH